MNRDFPTAVRNPYYYSEYYKYFYIIIGNYDNVAPPIAPAIADSILMAICITFFQNADFAIM